MNLLCLNFIKKGEVMYSFNSRVRYSELDKEQKLSLHSIINYFQDCSSFHSESINRGWDYLKEQNRVWLMSSWQILINKYPTLGEEIRISTWPYDFHSMYGFRNFLLEDGMGNHLAVANSIWVYMDTLTNRPVKVTEDDINNYGLTNRYPMEYASRKINLPSTLTSKEPFQVVGSNIDINQHVNNGEYIKMACEYLPSGFNVKQMRAEYKASALLGDTIIPMLYRDDKIFTVVLASVNKKPYTIVEFTEF